MPSQELKKMFREARTKRGTVRTKDRRTEKPEKAEPEPQKKQPLAQNADKVDEPVVADPRGGVPALSPPESDRPGEGDDSVLHDAKRPKMEVPRASGPPGAALPEGFFEDAEADAKARGVKPRTQKDKELEFADFQKSIAQDLQEVAKQEERKAEAEALDRQEREVLEQKHRLEVVEGMKAKRKAAMAVSGRHNEGNVALGKRRHLKLDLPEISDDDDPSGDEADVVLDWRAKAV